MQSYSKRLSSYFPIWKSLSHLHIEFWTLIRNISENASWMIEYNSITRQFCVFVLFGSADQPSTGSVYGDCLELAGDVPDQGSGVKGYVRVVAYLVQDRYGG
jgi:hypothetical protein